MKGKKPANEESPYVKARIRLIPDAERIANLRILNSSTKKSFPLEFTRAMNELATREGLIHPGNLTLFNAKKIPFSPGFFR